jgi:hypothetical protein
MLGSRSSSRRITAGRAGFDTEGLRFTRSPFDSSSSSNASFTPERGCVLESVECADVNTCKADEDDADEKRAEAEEDDDEAAVVDDDVFVVRLACVRSGGDRQPGNIRDIASSSLSCLCFSWSLCWVDELVGCMTM